MKRQSSFFMPSAMALVFCLLLGCASTNKAETEKMMNVASSAEEQAVIQVAQDLFDAMRASNGEKVLALAKEGAILQSVGERDGQPTVNNTPIDQFAAAVGQPKDKVWDEQFWDPKVNINGRLASMWMSYAFYHGGVFSHCGVNSLQLFKDNDMWKILHLADTRQREGCEIPESVQPVVN